MAIELTAQMASVRGGGKILSLSEYNENPDLLLSELKARVLVSRVDKKSAFKHLGEGQFNILPKGNRVAILSIESSASYLSVMVALELARELHLDRPPRIIRVRKSEDGGPPSPAMGDFTIKETVYPITAGGKPRYLVASFSKKEDLQTIRTIFVVDDFLATGSTLNGGVRLGLELMRKIGAPESELTFVPMAGLGKPDQEKRTSPIKTTATLHKTITALDVYFGLDPDSKQPIIKANGFGAYFLQNATRADFPNES